MPREGRRRAALPRMYEEARFCESGGCVPAVCLLFSRRVEEGFGAFTEGRNGRKAYLPCMLEGRRILLRIRRGGGGDSRVFFFMLSMLYGGGGRRRGGFFYETSHLVDGGRAVLLKRPG